MNSKHAILKSGEISHVSETEFYEWVKSPDFHENATVEITTVEGVTISTMFIGVNPNDHFSNPVWFETVIIGGQLDNLHIWWETLDKARNGHYQTVAQVKKPEHPT